MNEENQDHRGTVVSSVSISKEFSDIIKQNNLSPTEIFRKGFLIEASEKGLKIPGINLNSALIKERIKKFQEINILQDFENMEQDFIDLETNLSLFRQKITKAKKEVGSNDV